MRCERTGDPETRPVAIQDHSQNKYYQRTGQQSSLGLYRPRSGRWPVTATAVGQVVTVAAMIIARRDTLRPESVRPRRLVVSILVSFA